MLVRCENCWTFLSSYNSVWLTARAWGNETRGSQNRGRSTVDVRFWRPQTVTCVAVKEEVDHRFRYNKRMRTHTKRSLEMDVSLRKMWFKRRTVGQMIWKAEQLHSSTTIRRSENEFTTNVYFGFFIVNCNKNSKDLNVFLIIFPHISRHNWDVYPIWVAKILLQLSKGMLIDWRRILLI